MTHSTRTCAQCGVHEPRRLWLPWNRMFKIWRGTSHKVDLCSFECSGKWYAPPKPTRCDTYRDLLEEWTQWWNRQGQRSYSGMSMPPVTDTHEVLACSICSGIVEYGGGRCAACGRRLDQ